MTSRFSTKYLDFPRPFEDFEGCRANAMYRFSTVANVAAQLSIFFLLKCMEQIKPDNPKEFCCIYFYTYIYTNTHAHIFLPRLWAAQLPAGPSGKATSSTTRVCAYISILWLTPLSRFALLAAALSLLFLKFLSCEPSRSCARVRIHARAKWMLVCARFNQNANAIHFARF